KVIFQHDNARPHVGKIAKATLEAFGWDVLTHTPYLPDIAPSDYITCSDRWHTGFRTSTSTIRKKWLNEWIASKDESFFHHGMQQLPDRWKNIIASDGKYF
ncbi:Histone-lysine N-methyltransferase SETMAR, partial [Harpegnathos saltator]